MHRASPTYLKSDRALPLLAALLALAVTSEARGQDEPEQSAGPVMVEPLSFDPSIEAARVDQRLLPDEQAVREELLRMLEAQQNETATPVSLPVGSASAATPQALPLPDGEGSIEGMGESFSPSLSSGALTFTVPIAIPAGRNGVQPSITLGYTSGGGSSEVGFGWALGVAAIARQTDRGLPRYVDGPSYHPEEDRFVYAGSHELVPVDSAAMSVLDGGSIPSELMGWQEYRSQVEGGFMRFFRSPDATRWVVQSPDGTRHDLGLLPASDGPSWVTSASERSLVASPDGSRIASWALVRTTDPHGSTIHYTYESHGGERYLSAVYYVSPASCASGGRDAARRCAASADDYGARVRFVYEARPDSTLSYRTGWRIERTRRLKRIEVTAAGASVGSRTLVRRYHFAYSGASYHSLLTSLTVEGRPHSVDPTTGAMVGDALVAESALGEVLVGPTLPPMRFSYTGESTLPRGVDGFPALDDQRRRGVGSPSHGAGDPDADLFDVNADGLVDLVVTDPVRFRTADGEPAVGVYFNGFSGTSATPSAAGTFSSPIPVALPPGLADAVQLTNPNVVPMDVDGDGRSDLLHMPRVASYGFFTPVRAPGNQASPAAQSWELAYLDVDLGGALDPRVDLSRDGQRIRVLDVNADGLVDVVRTSGNAIQTWLNLGWYEGGEGRFGSAIHGPGGWTLSTDPIESCLPASGSAVSFDDPEVRLADMNGDGLQDIVRISPGAVVWWPSLGHGRFGEDCAAGVTRAQPIVMRAPRDLGAEFDTIYLADLDGDGMTDLVRLGEDVLDTWFNMGGLAFSRRSTMDGLRWSRDLDRVVRFVDVDGSGTVDVLFARARQWEWVDPMGGRRPRMLASVDNGLGALSRFEYGTTATDYLRDLTAGSFFWQGRDDGECDARATEATGRCVVRSTGTPMVQTVLRATETSDRLDVLGVNSHVSRVEYAYHDGYYEGVEQEVRGFAATDVRTVGGTAQGTSITRSWMHQGRRPRSIAADRLAENPWEALKGATHLSETWEEGTNVYLGATHTTYRIHRLAVGLDGREISWAFASRTDEIRYDLTRTWTAAPAGSRVPFYGPEGGDHYPAVERYLVDSSGGVAVDTNAPGWSEPVLLRSAGYYAVIASTVDAVDHAGHVLERTAWGRVRGEWGEPLARPEEVVSHARVALLDPESWIWRPVESWTSGHGSAERLGWSTITYAPGSVVPELTTAHVSIPRAYEFAGDADGSEGFVQTAEDSVTSFLYDAWGQVVATCAGAPDPTNASSCLRYATVARDAAYDHVVESESLSTGGGVLTWTAEADRGLGGYVRTTDPRSAVGEYGYDGFGRATYVRVPPVRGCEGTTLPTSRITYELTADPTSQPLSRMEVTTFLDCHDPSDVSIARSYVDGLGRTRASLLRTDAPHAWVRTGLVDFTPPGQPYRTSGAAFLAQLEPTLSQVLAPAGEEWAQTGYDAFGRVRYTQPLGAPYTERTWFSYGALVAVECDPYDSAPPNSHVGVNTCTIVRKDGQGRVEDTIVQLRRNPGDPVEVHRLWPTYRADGALVRLERVHTADRAARVYAEPAVIASVERTFAVDSVGRRLASTDRDTDARRAGVTVTNSSWRYLYNRVGDLVAVRDPRGCGQNFYYDGAGRLIGEDYVSCGEAEPWRDESGETVPAGSIALGPIATPRRVEVRTHYDTYPAWVAGDLLPPFWAASTAGLVTASVDRGSRSVVAYDARGSALWTARQMVMIPDAPAAPAALAGALPSVSPSAAGAPGPRLFDEDHTYIAESTVDHAGRPRSSSLPLDPDFAGGTPPQVGGSITYDRRGLPRSVSVEIDGAVHPVIASATYERDGLLRELVFGDDKGGARAPTRTQMMYDARRRPDRMTTTRAATVTGAPDRPLAAVSIVMDQDLDFDAVDNLSHILDLRPANEWPDGHRPQSVELTYDSLWRVTGAEYSYRGDSGSVVDTATDYRAVMAALEEADPMAQRPAPSVSAAPATRVMSLTWDYDFLGNTTEWTDDASVFHERSLDRITNGIEEANGRPSAIRLATNIPTDAGAPGTDRGGWLEVDYGDSGNVAALTVHGGCRDASPTDVCVDPGGSVSARRAGLRAGCVCDTEQHYQYRFDELNQIVDARRYDRAGSGSWTLAAHLRYAFDGAQQRTVKEVRDVSTGDARYAIWPYAGDFERRGLVRGSTGYEATAGTETSYLVGGARIVWQSGTPGVDLDPDHRITVPIPDLIGTSTAVIDLLSGELVEASTYYPNGARETVRANDIADIPLEPAGFTGKEADEEVGLTYFGMRFLMPRLGRWATPDPLHIHAEGGGEAMNNYHYISGHLLQSRDPIGLEPSSPPAPPAEPISESGGIFGAFKASWEQIGQARADADAKAQRLVQVFRDVVEPKHGANSAGGCMEAHYSFIGVLIGSDYANKQSRTDPGLWQRVYRESRTREKARGLTEGKLNSINLVYELMVADGHAEAPVAFDVNRAKTSFIASPEEFIVGRARASSDAYQFYGVAVSNGYHSLGIMVDNTGDTPKIYWLDQYSDGKHARRPGWFATDTVDVTGSLDEALLSVAPEKKTTTTRIWAINPVYGD